jgi:hypothetical protein
LLLLLLLFWLLALLLLLSVQVRLPQINSFFNELSIV